MQAAVSCAAPCSCAGQPRVLLKARTAFGNHSVRPSALGAADFGFGFAFVACARTLRRAAAGAWEGMAERILAKRYRRGYLWRGTTRAV